MNFYKRANNLNKNNFTIQRTKSVSIMVRTRWLISRVLSLTYPLKVTKLIFPKYLFLKIKQRINTYIKHTYAPTLRSSRIKMSAFRRLASSNRTVQLKLIWNSLVPHKFHANPLNYSLTGYTLTPSIIYVKWFNLPPSSHKELLSMENPPRCYRFTNWFFQSKELTKEEIMEAARNCETIVFPEYIFWGGVMAAVILILIDKDKQAKGEPRYHEELKAWWKDVTTLPSDSESDSDSWSDED